MKYKTILIFLLLIITFMNTASADDTWTSDSSIMSGLTDKGWDAKPTIFLDGSTRKLISGNDNGQFYGWYWSGSTWVEDSAIVSGLGDIGYDSDPTVFNDSGTLKLISADRDYAYYGWYWSGSTWVSDSSIVSGLTYGGVGRRPEAFLDGSTLKLISGDGLGQFHGYYWSGSTWVYDTSIVSGLANNGWGNSLAIYNEGGTLKLISCIWESNFYGYYWSGSTWVSDPSIVSGIVISGDKRGNSPAVYLDGNTLKLIHGEYYGTYIGYRGPDIFSLSGTISDESGAVSNATITLDNSGGSITSNETGYYEFTGLYANIYSIDVTSSLHEEYSDSVTITSDSEKNILLTLIPLEIISIIAPPPVIPVEEPTPLITEDAELTIFEETIEKLSDLSILITNLMGKGLTWAFLLTSYIGALASSILIKGNDEEGNLIDILLFGTIGWIVPMFINFSGLLPLISESFLLNAIVFAAFGFVIYTIGDAFSKD